MKQTELRLVEGGDPVLREAAAWFARLRADDVTEADRGRWRLWLESNDQHRTAYERIERLWSGFGEHAPHPEIALRLRAYASPAPAPSRARRKHPQAWWAVAAVMAVACGFAWRILPGDRTVTQEYATAIGERRSFRLDDGSQMDMDAATNIRVSYSGKERRIDLDHGRAYFKVAKEQNRPLIVHTDSGSVRAVGTEFEVNRQADAVEVALFEGKVQVFSVATRDVPLGVLEPGQKVRFGKTDKQLRVDSVAIDMQPAWLTGRLVFEDQPLSDVIAEFNRYSRDQIEIADTKTQHLRVNGVFRSDDPHAFVGALRDTYGVVVTVMPSGSIRLAGGN